MKKSKIDSIIIDLILDHYNERSLDNRESVLTDNEFDNIVKFAEEIWYNNIMSDTPVGIEGEA
jgi:hypothetical protein